MQQVLLYNCTYYLTFVQVAVLEAAEKEWLNWSIFLKYLLFSSGPEWQISIAEMVYIVLVNSPKSSF